MKRQKDEPDGLTPREWQVLALIREGLTNEQIAERLGISFGTAKYHVAEIISKLNADDRHDAVRKSDEKRSTPALLPWLPLSGRLGWPAAAASIALIAVVTLVLIWGSRSGDTGGNATALEENAGLDISPQTLAAVEQARATTEFKRTILLSHGEPQNVGTQGPLIGSLPTVSTLAELEIVLTDDVAVIVIDKSAEGEVSTDFLYEQWEAGRAIVGLNLCFIDLPESNLNTQPGANPGVVTEIAPDGTVRYYDTDRVTGGTTGCTWPLRLAEAGFPYLSYVPTYPSLEKVQAARERGENLFGGPAASRLDLPANYECLVKNLLAHLEDGAISPFNSPECR
jgi:DNA-binding CsgD family transcriptional regulator